MFDFYPHQQGLHSIQAFFTSFPGNHLHTYALLSALSLASKDNTTFLLASSTWRRITKTFKSDHLLLGSIEQLCLCRNQSGLAAKVWSWSRWEEPLDINLDVEEPVDVTLPNLQPSTITLLWPAKGLGSSPARAALLESATASITSSLVFKTELVEKAERRLEKAKAQWWRRNKKLAARESVHQLTVVGVHHRQGDHGVYERLLGIPTPTISYIAPCLDLYRRHFGPATLFIYVSDQPDWGKRRLGKHRDVVVAEGGTGDEDLALLSLTSNTILTRGTFSQWAGLLAGGRHLHPRMFSHTAWRPR